MSRHTMIGRTVCIILFSLLVVVALIIRRTNEPVQYDMPPIVFVYGEEYITYADTWPSDEEREAIVKESSLHGFIVELKNEPDESAIMSADEPVNAQVYVNSEYPEMIFVKSDERINLYESVKNRGRH